VPDITLGQSHDFRAQIKPLRNKLGRFGHRFGFSGLPAFARTGNRPGETASTSAKVTLENPSVNSKMITPPSRHLSAPARQAHLAIEIHSTDSYTGTATVDQYGEWEFTPPQGLSAGQHSITIAILIPRNRTSVDQNFIIAAAARL
jgi:hypothetical protein